MNTSTLDITEARRKLTKMDERLRVNPVIWVTRHDKRAFAIVDTEMMETVLETMEILADPEACEMLHKSLADIRAGRVHDHEDVKSELL